VVEVIDLILFYIGVALVFIGGVMDILATIGFFKFKEFYTRLHAATIGSIGGGLYPLIGVVFIVLGLDIDYNLKLVFTGTSIIAAGIIALATPAGSHILARGVYRSREESPSVIIDRLGEDLERGEME